MIGFGHSKKGLQLLVNTPKKGALNRQAFDEDQVFEVMHACIEWAKTFDIKIATSGRHFEYLKVLDQYPDLGRIDRLDIDEKRRLYYAIYEVHEFDRIRRHLSDIPSLEIANRLQDYVKGPFFYDDENPANSGNHARNIGLELSVGSELVKRGFNIKYSEFADFPEPAILLTDSVIPVQCKRIASVNKIKKRLSDASKQLEKNMINNPDYEPGLVVLDITKIVSENFSVSISHTAIPPELKHQHQLISRLFDITLDGFKSHEHLSIQTILLRASWVEYMKDIDEYWFNYKNLSCTLRDGFSLTSAF